MHFSNNTPEAAWLILCGLPFYAATIWGCLRKDRLPTWAPYPAILYLTFMVVMMIHVWNINQGASMMWLAAIPPFAIFALGARQGLALSTVGLTLILTGFLFTEHVLPQAYVIRFACTYLLVAGFVFAFERKREQVMQQVETARQHIQTLEGMLRICGWCHKRMLDDDGNWTSTEQFFQERAPVQFTHTLCPNCEKQLMSEVQGPFHQRTGT